MNSEDTAIIDTLRSIPPRTWFKKWSDERIAGWLGQLRKRFPGVDLAWQAQKYAWWVEGKWDAGKHKWQHTTGFVNWIEHAHRDQVLDGKIERRAGGMTLAQRRKQLEEQQRGQT